MSAWGEAVSRGCSGRDLIKWLQWLLPVAKPKVWMFLNAGQSCKTITGSSKASRLSYATRTAIAPDKETNENMWKGETIYTTPWLKYDICGCVTSLSLLFHKKDLKCKPLKPKGTEMLRDVYSRQHPRSPWQLLPDTKMCEMHVISLVRDRSCGSGCLWDDSHCSLNLKGEQEHQREAGS